MIFDCKQYEWMRPVAELAIIPLDFKSVVAFKPFGS